MGPGPRALESTHQQGILLGKPGTGEIRGNIFMERFMHKARASINVHQHTYVLTNLLIIAAEKAFIMILLAHNIL